MDTDDLRESPNVELAERLIGKGFDVRIYDPIISPERLVGANLQDVEARLPHLGRLLVVLAGGGAGGRRHRRRRRRPSPRSWPPCCAAPPPRIIDLNGRLGAEVEALPATRGSAGDRDSDAPADRGQPGASAARAHHRPEPAGAVRPAGVAGVPVAARRRVRRHRGLPAGQGRPGPYQVLDGVDDLHVPARTRPGGSAARLRRRVRLLVPRRPRGWCSRPAGARPVRRHAGLQPAGHLLAAGPAGCAVRDGTRFVFDHHDLCPELYRVALPRRSRRSPYRGLLFLERATFRTADRVTSTNESYAAIARRPRRQGARATSPSSAPGPDPAKLRRGPAGPELRRGRRPPGRLPRGDGPAGRRRPRRPRRRRRSSTSSGATDIAFTFMGAGDCYAELVALRDELGLQDYVELPGRVPDETVADGPVHRRRRAVARTR